MLCFGYLSIFTVSEETVPHLDHFFPEDIMGHYITFRLYVRTHAGYPLKYISRVIIHG